MRRNGKVQKRSSWQEGDLFQFDEPIMGATWYGRLERARSAECWITLGVYVPYKNEDGSNVSDFWDSYTAKELAVPTFRQLRTDDPRFKNPDSLNEFGFLDLVELEAC